MSKESKFNRFVVLTMFVLCVTLGVFLSACSNSEMNPDGITISDGQGEVLMWKAYDIQVDYKDAVNILNMLSKRQAEMAKIHKHYIFYPVFEEE